MKTIIKLPQVKARTSLSRSAIYLQISEGTFPRQISLGVRSVGWVESEVQNWIDRQIEKSRGGCA